MPEPIRILLLEDSAADAELIRRELQLGGLEFVAVQVQNEAGFQRHLQEFVPDVILADYTLPAYDGRSALARVQRRCPDTPFIFVSGTMGEEAAIEALKQGATDYVLKQRLARLGPAVRRALAEAQEARQRRQAEQELRQLNQQHRALAGRLQTVREEERTRIAREIHDVLAQQLTLLKLALAWMSRRLAQPVDEATRALLLPRLAEAMQLTDTASDAVQKIATELRPVILDSLGLCAAIEWQVTDFQTRTGIACEANVPASNPPLDPQRSTALFRILQESLTNVARHARATRVRVSLGGDGPRVLLSVADNGQGLPPGVPDDLHSLGLLGMRERAALVDGQFEVASLPGQGTTVRVSVPVGDGGNG
jgi:signal transduction histidine kinase